MKLRLYPILLLCSIRLCGFGQNRQSAESLAQDVLKYGFDGNSWTKVELPVDYDAGGDYPVFQHYSVPYGGRKVTFILEFSNMRDKRYHYLNQRTYCIDSSSVKIIRYPHEEVTIDMTWALDYENAPFYFFKNDPSYLLVECSPMHWTGLMTRYYEFYQLIDLKEKLVVEFIRRNEAE